MEEEKKNLAERHLEMLESHNLTHLVAMAEAYFAARQEASLWAKATGKRVKWFKRMFEVS